MPAIRDGRVTFELPDPHRRFGAVRLWTDIVLGEPRPDLDFVRVDDDWRLSIPLPPVDRLEYQFIARERGSDAEPEPSAQPTDAEPEPELGAETYLLDPGNPRRVGGAFGDHSELALPGYRAPEWLTAEPLAADRAEYTLDTRVGPIDLQVWSPHGLGSDTPAPLLLAHDGPEFDALAGLTHAVGAAIGSGRLPAHRIALLAPGPRDERYAANDDYAHALCREVIPALTQAYRAAGPPTLMGASLGGLAALHAHWRHPGTMGGLFLASGSFFTPPLDPQESGYRFFDDIAAFVAQVGATPSDAPAARELPAVTMVCGTAEENLANNEELRATLGRWGDIGWGTVRDGHCYTCWRDLLDPHLIGLLARVAGQPPRAQAVAQGHVQ